MRSAFITTALGALAATSLAIGAPEDPASGHRVNRRGSEEPIEGLIIRLNDAGVTVKSELGASHLISWDRVRSIEGDRDDPLLDEWLAMAADLWRARTRLERHDTALAEPLFDRLLERYLGLSSETALVVAEGALRCRIARGAHADAVIPALETARLRRRSDIQTASYSSLEPVIDEGTALCPMLAPAWVDSRGLSRLEQDLADYDAQGDEVIAVIAQLYHQAVRRQLGLDPVDDPPSAAGHAGAELLELIIRCDDPSSDQRANARQRLERSIDDWPSWCEAWARFHIGRSLLNESGLGRQQRGLVSLAHLPARFAHDQPYIAGLALWYLAAGVEAGGDTVHAMALRDELSRRFPGHPIHLAAPASPVESSYKDRS